MRHRVVPQCPSSGCEEARGVPLVCPKPRRFRGWRRDCSFQAEMIPNSVAEAELAGIFAGEEEEHDQYFCGSPPNRASNPIVNDPRFGKEEGITASPPQLLSSHSSSSSPASAGRKGGPAGASAGVKPAAVRVVGFECNERRRGIQAVS